MKKDCFGTGFTEVRCLTANPVLRDVFSEPAVCRQKWNSNFVRLCQGGLSITCFKADTSMLAVFFGKKPKGE
jgi:hypothetical protein